MKSCLIRSCSPAEASAKKERHGPASRRSYSTAPQRPRVTGNSSSHAVICQRLAGAQTLNREIAHRGTGSSATDPFDGFRGTGTRPASAAIALRGGPRFSGKGRRTDRYPELSLRIFASGSNGRSFPHPIGEASPLRAPAPKLSQAPASNQQSRATRRPGRPDCAAACGTIRPLRSRRTCHEP